MSSCDAARCRPPSPSCDPDSRGPHRGGRRGVGGVRRADLARRGRAVGREHGAAADHGDPAAREGADQGQRAGRAGGQRDAATTEVAPADRVDRVRRGGRREGARHGRGERGARRAARRRPAVRAAVGRGARHRDAAGGGGRGARRREAGLAHARGGQGDGREVEGRGGRVDARRVPRLLDPRLAGAGAGAPAGARAPGPGQGPRGVLLAEALAGHSSRSVAAGAGAGPRSRGRRSRGRCRRSGGRRTVSGHARLRRVAVRPGQGGAKPGAVSPVGSPTRRRYGPSTLVAGATLAGRARAGRTRVRQLHEHPDSAHTRSPGKPPDPAGSLVRGARAGRVLPCSGAPTDGHAHSAARSRSGHEVIHVTVKCGLSDENPSRRVVRRVVTVRIASPHTSTAPGRTGCIGSIPRPTRVRAGAFRPARTPRRPRRSRSSAGSAERRR